MPGVKESLRSAVRKAVLPVLYRINPGDITIRNHFTGDRLRLHSFRHRSYWFYGKRREQATMSLFRRLVAPGDAVIEVGAHIGYTAQYLAHLAGPEGQVWTFEPGPNNLPYTRFNLEPLANITLVEKAVGSAPATTTFYYEEITGMNNSFNPEFIEWHTAANADAAHAAKDFGSAEVEIVTLDDFVEEQSVRPDLVKIDVESFEVEVLKGMQRVLRETRPVIMVEVWPRNTEAVRRAFDGTGYRFFREDLSPFAGDDALNLNVFCFHEEAHQDLMRDLGLV